MEAILAIKLTLSRNLNEISNPDSLTVVRVFPDPLAKPFVVGVCEVRHGEMKRLAFD
jgi:hypothetical protein